jgi:succinoglycan biosynthesis transport protein ExoP
VRRLNEQRVTLRAQLAEQSSTLLGGHPRIKELRAQISDLDRQIREEAVRISRSLDNDARIAGARVESLGASLDQLKKQASATNGQDVQLRALEREAKAQRDLLESYLAKYREATARESIETAPSDGRIISRAIVTNTPAFPKKLPIVLISTLATLLLTTGVVVMGELMRMTAPAGAAEQLAPIDAPRVTVREKAAALKSNLATPPEVAPEREAFVVEPDSEEASETPPIVVSEPTPESFGELEKVAKQLRNAGEGARKITVMGTSEPDATSRTALALARLLSRNSSVILIDLTLASPAIAAVSSDPDGPGLSDLVLGGASFGAIISRDLNSRVQLIGGGTMQADISILQSPRLMMAVDALTRVYDHVVLDAGTLDDVPEALASANAQAVLVAGGTLDDRTRTIIQDELLSAGFRGVSILSEPATAAGEKEPRMAAA